MHTSMSYIAFGLLLAPVCISSVPTCSTVECQFRSWTATHAKHDHVTAQSLEAFKDTLKHLAQRDARGLQGHGLSIFAATTPHAFAALNSYKPLNVNRTAIQSLSRVLKAGAAQELPSKFDWREKGGVLSSVKSQGTCGGCWAFSGVQGAESAWAIAGHGLTELSVQQVLDCDRGSKTIERTWEGRSINIGCNDNGCNGGNTICAGDYISKGLESDADYPFTGKTTDSSACAYDGSKVVASGISAYQLEQSEDAIAAGLATGPVSVSVDATSWQYYQSGVLTGCSNQGVNHAVQIVGYGTDDSAGDYWTIRNSWGESWGERGYIRVPRGVNCHGLLTEPGTVFSTASVGPIQPTSAPKSSPFITPADMEITKCVGWSWTWDWGGRDCFNGHGVSAKVGIIFGAILAIFLCALLCRICLCCRGGSRNRRREAVVVYQEPLPVSYEPAGVDYVRMDQQYRV